MTEIAAPALPVSHQQHRDLEQRKCNTKGDGRASYQNSHHSNPCQSLANSRSYPTVQVGCREPGPAVPGTNGRAGEPRSRADVSPRESSCAGAPGVFHTRHKWLPAAAGGKYQGRKAWQARDFRRGQAAPHLTWGHGIFDRTITIAELIKYIWKGFRVGFGIGYEGPRNPLWGLKSVAKLQQKPYVVPISTFCFPTAPFSRPAPSRDSRHQGSGTTSHLDRNPRIMMAIIPNLFSVICWLPCLFSPSQGAQHQVYAHMEGLASHAPSETPRSFRKEVSPRWAVPSRNKSPTAGGWDLQDSPCTQEQLRRKMVTIRDSFHPVLSPPALCSGHLLAPALAFRSSPTRAGAVTSTQFSLSCNKKWKLKAVQAADKELLKSGWGDARDGVQGRGGAKAPSQWVSHSVG